MEPLLTPEAAAKILGIAARTVRDLAYRHEIQSVRIGKLYRFRPEHLESYVRRHETAIVRSTNRVA